MTSRRFIRFQKFIIPVFFMLSLLFIFGKETVQASTPQSQNLAPQATITVTTTDDELNADGDCSLREAIQAANTDTAIDGCSAGSGDDIITLSDGTYSISLAGKNEDNNATGDFDITQNLTINGIDAANTVIDANQADRVFHALNNALVVFNDLTIENGELLVAAPTTNEGVGGGIWGETGTTIQVYRSIIRNNSAVSMM